VVIRAYGRENKTKKFLTSPFPSAGGVGGAENIERKFLVLLRRFSLRKEHFFILSYFDCSFLRPHDDRGASSPSLVIALNSVTSTVDSGDSKNMDCARHKQICMCLTPPFAHKSPPFLGDVIKRHRCSLNAH
jgi:hypothetical protein